MKHIKPYEQFLNEGKVTIEKIKSGEISIGLMGKEVIFSGDRDTLSAVINALNDKNRDSEKKLWTAIESIDGDIYIEKGPESDVIILKQLEDNSRDEVTLKIPISELNSIIKDLKRIK